MTKNNNACFTDIDGGVGHEVLTSLSFTKAHLGTLDFVPFPGEHGRYERWED